MPRPASQQLFAALLVIGACTQASRVARAATPDAAPTAASESAPPASGPAEPTAAAEPQAIASTEAAAGAESAGESAATDAPVDPPCGGACWDEVFERSSLGFGMGVGVAYLPEMSSLNQRITPAGYDELGSFSSYFVMSVPVSIDHLMLLAQVRMTSISNESGTTGFDSLHGMISAGYSITPPEVLAIYPYAGIGIASATLTLGQTAPLGATFDQVVAASQGPLELSSLAFIGTTGMAAEMLVARTDDHPTRGIFIGGRVGVTACFSASNWSLGTGLGTVPDGPPPPLGGYFAELTAGLRL